MRQAHVSATPVAVHRVVHQAVLNALPWTGYKRSVTACEVVDLLLRMAVVGATLFAVVRRRFRFSRETARKAVQSQLPDIPMLTAGLVRALYQVAGFSRLDRKRRWRVAIDTHSVPFYGDPKTPGVSGGHKKLGTHYSFTYATAVLMHKRRRYTVGLIACDGLKPHEIVAALFSQLETHGLKVLGIVLDSAFDSGETILFLREKKVFFTVPLRRKGRGSNNRNQCFSWKHGTIGRVTWKVETTRRLVDVQVLVWRRAGTKPQSPDGSRLPKPTKKKGTAAKDAATVRVFAFEGWGRHKAVSEQRRAWLARRRYRERFAIETSYRQKNALQGWTTSCHPAYRLLLEGIGYLLRQAWVKLTEEIAQTSKLSASAWVGCFTSADLRELLLEHLNEIYAANHRNPLQTNELQ
jgi:hypothetical protein